jgi:molecular chaperone IbpA|tara:strand:- start:7198 stop:7611 length:414 start_codon:yes stop_codon:yes gene_type:complete
MTNFKETFLFNDFDLVWKNLFDQKSSYLPVRTNKINYPVDIYKTDNGIQFEIAAVGKDKSDIEIITEGETLRIKYQKDVEEQRDFIHKGIANRNFDFAWKISKELDLSKAEAIMEKGLLLISIPYTKDRAPKQIVIK